MESIVASPEPPVDDVVCTVEQPRRRGATHDAAVARILGAATPGTRASLAPTTIPPPAITPAVRGVRPGWRDPRLWVGVVILAASVLLGTRLVASADDTVEVWATSSDMGPGEEVTAADLVAVRVHFEDADGLAGYYRVQADLPADLQLTRAVGAGELLPRTAVGSGTRSGLLELPISVDPEQVPGSVAEGSVVDVYVVSPPSGVSGGATGASPGSGPAISAATVVDAPGVSTSFGSTGKRQLVLAVPDAEAAAFFALLARYDAAVLTVVRRN
jgi:hypothetical protein